MTHRHRANVMNERAEKLLATLSRQQHLRPHRPIGAVLAEVTSRLGVCAVATDRAANWLELDPNRPIGRLRATELMQLARCLQRMWEQTTPAEIRSRH